MPTSTSPSYDDALAFWHSRINYEHRNPGPGDLKLDRMRALLHLLGDPQDRLRIIHIAGSKGKGSTAAMLATILNRAGQHTGLFTSPHLCRVEERIQIDGQPISPDELIALLDEMRALLRQAPELEPTFFEIATALGFCHFRRRGVDAAVIEVGLGGRFDSTNVCQPVLAVITSISYDHTQQLGDRLSSIAFEKAGIIKPGRPVVSGVTAAEARAVIERIARERSAPLRELGRDFHYQYVPGRVTYDTTTLPQVRIEPGPAQAMELGLHGDHQGANAAVAVATIEALRGEGWTISDAAVAAGLAEIRWPARLEVLGRRPLVVLDCAHNVASAEALVATLCSSFPTTRRWLIFAASADKDLSGMMRVLAPHFAHVFLTRYAGSARGMPPEELARLLRGTVEMPHSVCPTALEAWQTARTRAAPEDLICITGSVFLAGELRPMLLLAA
jgi:dihydrofolate synthase/folylpolyglutamate synthase